MHQRKFHIIFSLIIALLITAPAVFRVAVALLPGLGHHVEIQPIPELYTFNINNGKGIKGKVKGLYMDLSHNLNQYDAWYKTGFTLRNELLDVYKTTKLDILHSQPYPDKVIIGRNGWMFTGDHFDKSLSEQLGLSRMSPDEINDLADMIAGLQQWCENSGIYYLFLPTWGKAGIYNDSIPMKHSAEPNTLEQLIKALRSKGVRVINSRPELKKHAGRGLYFKHDSHWNGHGAWIAYQQLRDSLLINTPDLPHLTAADVYADTSLPATMDLTNLMGLRSPYPSIYIRPKKTQAFPVQDQLTVPQDYNYVAPTNYEFRFRNKLARQKVVVFRDSFFVHLEPLLIESFEESVIIWHRIPDTAIVSQENPDILIHQISERLINDMYFEMKRRTD